MMAIHLPKILFTKLSIHGIQAYPEECCGAMLGTIDSKNQLKIVTELVKIENSSNKNKHRRFTITSQDYMQLEKKAKEKKLTLLGFYHTHPDHPCQPSQTDLKYSWPFFSYIILSIKDGNIDKCRSFFLDEKLNEFKEESFEII